VENSAGFLTNSDTLIKKTVKVQNPLFLYVVHLLWICCTISIYCCFIVAYSML